MTAFIFGSAWLWWLAGSLLWGYVGVLAASTSALPLTVGAIAGAVTWFVGVGILLLFGSRIRQAVRPGHAAPEYPSAAQSAVPSEASRAFVPLFDDDEPLAGLPAWSTAVAAVGPPRPHRYRRVSPTLLLVVVVLGGSAILVSAFLPWGSGSASWGSGSGSSVHIGWSPSDFGPVATMIVVSGLGVAALGVLAGRRLRGRWLTIGMMIAVSWFTLGLQVFLSVSGTAQLSQIATDASGESVSAAVSTGSGLWLLCIGAGAVLVWGVFSAAQLLMERSRP